MNLREQYDYLVISDEMPIIVSINKSIKNYSSGETIRFNNRREFKEKIPNLLNGLLPSKITLKCRNISFKEWNTK